MARTPKKVRKRRNTSIEPGMISGLFSSMFISAAAGILSGAIAAAKQQQQNNQEPPAEDLPFTPYEEIK